jgi:hypothetical protein
MPEFATDPAMLPFQFVDTVHLQTIGIQLFDIIDLDSESYICINTGNMQLTAKLIQLLPLQTGTGKNGQWKKQDIIVETEATYPKKICVSVWGDKIDAGQLQPGNQLKIDFDVESREYNGRWYTDVKAWKIELAGNVVPAGAEKAVGNMGPENSNNDDDLPF